MYFVYILYSEKDGKLYVGCSGNLNKRIARHNNGLVLATKNRRPLVCIYYESFTSKGEAFARERYLKSLWSAHFKEKIKKDYLNKQSA
ncbi:MAG: nuclease superfamily protein [Candidatus Nomurabacteria bacterium]|nr:nuclease superfamily protein [Candidatus Nomurabacteria bacterium]